MMINTDIKILLSIIILICWFGNTTIAEEHSYIQPGKGLGVFKIGERYQEIQKKLGKRKPDKTTKVNSKEMWISYYDMGLTFVFSYKDKILQKIVVTSKGLLVERTGIRIGSSEKNLVKYYGEAKVKEDYDKQRKLWEYKHLGVNFLINKKNHAVEEIIVIQSSALK